MSDKRFLREIKEQLLHDKKRKYDLLLKMRRDFARENTERMHQKRSRDEQERKDN